MSTPGPDVRFRVRATSVGSDVVVAIASEELPDVAKLESLLEKGDLDPYRLVDMSIANLHKHMAKSMSKGLASKGLGVEPGSGTVKTDGWAVDSIVVDVRER